MPKTYGQLAYEAGLQFWDQKIRERDALPKTAPMPWNDLEPELVDYWEAVAKAVAVATHNHHSIVASGGT